MAKPAPSVRIWRLLSMSISTAIPTRGVVDGVALALAVAGFAAAGPAHADPCQTVVVHGQTHTAANVAVNDQSFTGPIDGTGCDYAVYIGPGVNASVSSAHVFDYFKAGVVVDGT